jgi:hypothetical protein
MQEPKLECPVCSNPLKARERLLVHGLDGENASLQILHQKCLQDAHFTGGGRAVILYPTTLKKVQNILQKVRKDFEKKARS